LLRKDEIVSDGEIEGMTKEITAEIEEAFNFAISSPFPTEEELHKHLYAD